MADVFRFCDPKDMERALGEFRTCTKALLQTDTADRVKVTGLRYALDMAAEECRLLGLDPSKITPYGYDTEEGGGDG